MSVTVVRKIDADCAGSRPIAFNIRRITAPENAAANMLTVIDKAITKANPMQLQSVFWQQFLWREFRESIRLAQRLLQTSLHLPVVNDQEYTHKPKGWKGIRLETYASLASLGQPKSNDRRPPHSACGNGAPTR